MPQAQIKIGRDFDLSLLKAGFQMCNPSSQLDGVIFHPGLVCFLSVSGPISKAEKFEWTGQVPLL